MPNGYGDYLIVSAVSRNIKHDGRLAGLVYTTSASKDKVLTKIKKLELFKLNPYIDELIIEPAFKFMFRKILNKLLKRNWTYIPVRKISNLYAKPTSSPSKYAFRRGAHAISYLSELFGAKSCELIPSLVLSETEEKKVDRIISENNLDSGFIVVEPNIAIKSSNKRYKEEYWQELVDKIKYKYPDLKIVKISPGACRLYNIQDVSGHTTFREALRFLQRAETLIVTEGALAHLAAAAQNPGIVITPGFIPLELIQYPIHKYIQANVDCLNCGWVMDCPNNLKCMDIKPDTILDKLDLILSLKKHNK